MVSVEIILNIALIHMDNLGLNSYKTNIYIYTIDETTDKKTRQNNFLEQIIVDQGSKMKE